jgi:hypothetical protein
MHLPELSLRSRRLCRFGRPHCMRMSLHRRKMSKHKAEIVAEKLPHLFDYREKLSAMDAFEVSVFDQRDRSVSGAD